MVSINRLFSKNIPLIFLLVIALFLRLYKIGEAFQFEYDQEVPAMAAYDFIVDHKITLVGQELSFEGFFLGPLHNWIQFIPYGFCGLLPDCVPYFYTLISISTIVILYFVVKKIFDRKTAIIACAIYAVSFSEISFERGVNSNYFLFLSSIGLLFCLYKYFSGENKFLIFGAFIAGLATVNFNPIYIFSTMAFFLSAFMRSKREVYVFIVAGFAFLINYFPLVIFNFRHDNILFSNFLNFIRQNTQTTDYVQKFLFLLKDVSIPFFAYYLFQSGALFFSLVTFILIVLGSVLIISRKNYFYLFLPIWIIVTFFGLIFYKGWVPNYYFQQTLLPMILLVSISARKFFLFFLTFSVIFLYLNISKAVNFDSWVNYLTKKNVVEFILNDTKSNSFNVYNGLPISLNTGYPTLFKLLGRSPQEGGENLYILHWDQPAYFLKLKYQKAFPGKMVDIGFDKFVKIVSIKNVN